jgi:hypothetical protein
MDSLNSAVGNKVMNIYCICDTFQRLLGMIWHVVVVAVAAAAAAAAAVAVAV